MCVQVCDREKQKKRHLTNKLTNNKKQQHHQRQ